jgi:hypothetical protein
VLIPSLATFSLLLFESLTKTSILGFSSGPEPNTSWRLQTNKTMNENHHRRRAGMCDRMTTPLGERYCFNIIGLSLVFFMCLSFLHFVLFYFCFIHALHRIASYITCFNFQMHTYKLQVRWGTNSLAYDF